MTKAIERIGLAVFFILVSFVAPYFIQTRILQKFYYKYNLLPPFTKEAISKFCESRIGASFIDKIDEHVYIGDLCSAIDQNAIAHYNISKIVNSCQRCPSPFATQGIEYLEVPLREDMDEDDISDIVDAMNKAVAFIENAKKHGHSVLIHDASGISQATAIAAAYFVQAKNLDAERALTAILILKPGSDPSEIYRQAVRQFAAVNRQK